MFLGQTTINLAYLSVYPPDSLESNGGANIKGKQLPQPASRDAKILLSACNLIEILLKFRTISSRRRRP